MSALLLAMTGVFGVMGYTVRQRTREIGIRIALGAEARRVQNMVVVDGMRLTLCGLAIELGSAVALTRLMSPVWD